MSNDNLTTPPNKSVVASETRQRFTYDKIKQALLDNYGIISDAARQLGCSRWTIHDRIKEYPDLKQVQEEGRQKIVDLAEAALVEKIKSGDITAIIFTLKSVGARRGWIEAQYQRNINLNVNTDLSAMPAEALDNLLAQMDKDNQAGEWE